jgi:hypothetical protein
LIRFAILDWTIESTFQRGDSARVGAFYPAKGGNTEFKRFRLVNRLLESSSNLLRRSRRQSTVGGDRDPKQHAE